ncbi:hypothetical protein FEN17_20705 [Dyadobacter luticola]|uniref:Uncharacterized protein n=2 Tax=Dyadobacter luticola TaxID=1979387 RepID=A0A5R9KU66_9BACT|nr:hypothetical protein FEN17_20705 [Dyadobacter luticola]
MNPAKFTGQEGALVSAKDALQLTSPHRKKEKDCRERGENFVRAEFFGIHTFNQLIDQHGDNCVGFRAYYGVVDEDDMDQIKGKADRKKATPRLILVPVDAQGNDLTHSAQLGALLDDDQETGKGSGGMKDMPAQKEVMRGGPLCPSDC